jgi:hypothetical protein
MTSNKNMLYVGGAAVALAAIVGGYLWYRASSVQVELSPEGAGSPAAAAGDSTIPAPTTGTPAAPAPATGTGSTGTGSVTQSYADALKQYGTSGFRYQFVNCRGTPGKLVVKRGQKFMMDNRDAKAHKFVVQGRSFSISGLGFAIVTASTVGTSKITCDGGGSADLVVQR